MVLFEKFGQHQPLNRQAERYAKKGVDLSLSTLADQVGACAAALEPLHALIRTHVRTAERLHGDDTTLPLLAKGGTQTARLWTYVRDDRPFGGAAPPAALFYFSRDDAHGGYNHLYRGGRDPGPVLSTLCWSHARRKFFELAHIKEKVRQKKPAYDISPVALEAVKKIDAIFDAERQINGLDVTNRLDARHQLVRLLLDDLHDRMRAEQGAMLKHNPVARAIAYMFKKHRWDAFKLFLEDGRICLTNNAAERALAVSH